MRKRKLITSLSEPGVTVAAQYINGLTADQVLGEQLKYSHELWERIIHAAHKLRQRRQLG